MSRPRHHDNGHGTPRRRPSVRHRLAAALAAALFGLATAPAHAISIAFAPPTQTVALGSQAAVDVVVADPGGLFVGAWDMVLDFDAAILSLDDVLFGSALGGPLDSIESFTPGGAGTVSIAGLSFLLDLSGVQDAVSDFVLFTAVFDTLAAGTSALGLTGNVGGDPSVFLGDDFGQPINLASVGTGSITVAPAPPVAMPEPHPLAIALLASALLVMSRRRRRASAALGERSEVHHAN